MEVWFRICENVSVQDQKNNLCQTSNLQRNAIFYHYDFASFHMYKLISFFSILYSLEQCDLIYNVENYSFASYSGWFFELCKNFDALEIPKIY